jgi:hypothetical protein
MNGIYWEKGIPPLFTMEDLKEDNYALTTIADILMMLLEVSLAI